jgi:DivIVA domain-containing protein
MTLTPEDVHKKTFTPVRLREGYDMGEVDQFLDEVEAELTRLHGENDELRSRLGDSSAAADGGPSTAPGTVAAAVPSSATSDSSLPVVSTIAEASGAAARLLEIAAQNADQLVAEAHGDADKIVGEATVKAQRLESESKEEAERLAAEIKERADKQAAELAQRRQEVLGRLEQDKDTLAGELEELRSFEREYRSRLRAYFESQLRTLDGQGAGEVSLSPDNGSAPTGDPQPPASGASSGSDGSRAGDSSSEGSAPGRLRDLLSEDPQQ